MITTHVAGIQIVVGKYNIQRCIICGHAIILEDLSRIVYSHCEGSNDKPFKPSCFDVGALIEINKEVGGIAQYITKIGMLEEDFKVENLPKNICLDLLEL